MNSPKSRVNEGFRRLAIAAGLILAIILGAVTLFIFGSQPEYSRSLTFWLGISVASAAFFIVWGAIRIVGWIIEGFFSGNAQNTEPETENIHIESHVDTEEYSRLFANALLDETGRKVLLGLMEASGNNVTSREISFLKYALGEIDRESLMEALSESDPADHEILERQMNHILSIQELRGENT